MGTGGPKRVPKSIVELAVRLRSELTEVEIADLCDLLGFRQKGLRLDLGVLHGEPDDVLGVGRRLAASDGAIQVTNRILAVAFFLDFLAQPQEGVGLKD